MRTLLLFTLLIASFFLDSTAQKKWEPKHIVKTESASSFVFSENGDRFVWRKRRISEEKDRWVFDLWVTYLNGNSSENVQLTRSEFSDSDASLSTDGNSLYFLSSEDDKSIFRMDLRGGVPSKVYTHFSGISDLSLISDQFLYFTSDEGDSYYEISHRKLQDDTEIVEDSTLVKPQRVFRYNIKDEKVKRITNNRYTVAEYSVTDDRKWMITVHRKSEHYASDGRPHPDYFLWNLESGEKTEILANVMKPGSFKSSNDSKGFWFVGRQTSDSVYAYVGISQLYYFDIESKSSEKVALPEHDELGGGGFHAYGNGVLVSYAKGAYNPWIIIEKDKKGNWVSKNLEMPYSRGTFYLSKPAPNGTVIANVSDAQTPTRYVFGKISSSRRNTSFQESGEFVKLNTFINDLPIAKAEVITWTGAEGDQIEGILYYPYNYQEGKKYALIVGAHGGPDAADFDEWDSNSSYPVNLFAQRGSFFLKPNYHGSTGYGFDFVASSSGQGRYYDRPLEDIITGIDYLSARGLIDKNNMGVMGWSNGAIYATMLSVRYPDMFKAVGAGAGDVNWTSDFGTCRFGVQFDQLYIGGAPYDDVDGKIYNERYILDSPLFELEKVKSPTIIFHGSEDRAVPRDQGWEYYRALQQANNTPVKFLWFPGQPHGLQKVSHRIRKLVEEMKWFDTYMFGLELDEELPIPEKSMFKTIDDVADFSNRGVIGEKKGSTLIPPTRSFDGLKNVEVGVFEVTQAQWAEFDPTTKESASYSANKPVVVNELEEIRKYLAWLNEKTGESYRLPTLAEQKTIFEKVKSNKKNENTLERWLGYEINYDDYLALDVHLINKHENLMVANVGFFGAYNDGKNNFFDIGGNIAEWASDQVVSDVSLTENYLPSVTSHYDSANEKFVHMLRNMGLRVIKEVKN